MTHEIVCLTGGIGGAKLALGLYRTLPADALMLAINTGDDFTHLGLEIWPDFDTTLYTLSGVSDRERGWGRANESWTFLETLGTLGGEKWFQLGDRDLATHVLRHAMLQARVGRPDVARALTKAFKLDAALAPATSSSLATKLETDAGRLDFQDYFVRRRAAPVVSNIVYEGADSAALDPSIRFALANRDLRGVIIAPSNPLLSIGPILAVQDCREALAATHAPVVAVTPIIGGKAVKGPTGKIMAELKMEISPLAVAGLYCDVLDGFVIDEKDAGLAPQIEHLGIACHVAQTLMQTDADKVALARSVLGFVDSLAANTRDMRT